MAVSRGTMNYTTDGIDKCKGFPRSQVALGRWGQMPNVPWTKNMKCGAHVSLIAAAFFPDSKHRHPSTAGLTERHFQTPAERSVSDPQPYVL